ncbi:MAG: hypothetical protein GQ540_01525 [Lutibacter sp.]|uniref:hypothetical protein n=1 Tax=Lutibacter sp. TaxID=1925666 RepID=UPI0019D9D392|nr:hypothetical protein [Lutibacter sp.]NOR27187.1 hypothetical protein [Lutibacter sp.]
MEKIKIRYKRMHLRWKFIFGLFWLILGAISITNNPENYFNYGYLIASLFYFVNYFFKSKNQYLTFDNDSITLNNFISQRISLADLNQIKKDGRNYIFQSEKSELRINTRLIDKNSLKDLKVILKNLNTKN